MMLLKDLENKYFKSFSLLGKLKVKKTEEYVFD